MHGKTIKTPKKTAINTLSAAIDAANRFAFVNSSALAVAAKFKEHVKFQEESEADALALWVVMTYVMEHLEIAPMVYVTSPEPMYGKSTVMKLLKVFCHRAEMVSKITPAAIYRLIERDQPTLIFDEADRFLRGNDELNGIINAGHARFEANVIINKKLADGNYDAVTFPV